MAAEPTPQSLPIDDVREPILNSFRRSTNLVITAEPGAGKTTRFPLWLLDEPTLKDQRIILLEPRRIAARAAALRLAESLGEPVGKTVGIRMRGDSRTSESTRLEVVTEGVFTRMVLSDPEMKDVGAVLFDEFHERSLDADLGLALALDVQSALRDDMKLIVMSATIDSDAVEKLLGDAETVHAEGRMFPVETRYLGQKTRAPIPAQISDAIAEIVTQESGSVLAFLPGKGEIEATRKLLQQRFQHDPSIVFAPLYSGLPDKAQKLALSPPPAEIRKVVLATTVAQTSLTIDGIRVVVDSGLVRQPRYNPQTDISRLETVRVSKSAADQRRGRAGRLEPGVCYRMWAEPEQRGLAQDDQPEILEADLSTFVLVLAEWGVQDPADLKFLTLPGRGQFQAAVKRMRTLGALDDHCRITETGRKLAHLPLPTDLAAMVLAAAQQSDTAGRSAIMLAAHLASSNGDREIDLRPQLAKAAHRSESVASALQQRLCRSIGVKRNGPTLPYENLGPILALARPEWVAANRGNGQFQLAAGQRAKMPSDHPLAAEKYLAIADLMGASGQLRITAALPLHSHDFEELANKGATQESRIYFDQAALCIKGETRRRLGAITLESKPLKEFTLAEAEELFWSSLSNSGLDVLPLSNAFRSLQSRMAYQHRQNPEIWPDVSDAVLATTFSDWLAPFCPGVVSVTNMSADQVLNALRSLAPEIHKIDAVAPTHFTLPDGQRARIDYADANGPTVHARVQSFFGHNQHPCLPDGTPLILDLESPAGRSLQITKDLPKFWSGSWRDVRADMRGRYPKHHWPDDPASAEPRKPKGSKT